MKSLLENVIIILALGLMTACASQTNGVEETLRPSSDVAQPPFQEDDNQKPAEIPPNIPALDKIVFFPKNHTWQDLDQFYREEMPKHEGLPYYENLQNIFFYHLNKQFNLCEEANPEKVAFYIEEQAKMNYVLNFKEFTKCLLSLEGYWSNAKIKALAKEVLQKGMKVIENFPKEKQSKIFMNEYGIIYYDKIMLLPA